MSKAERTRDYIIEKTAPVFNKKGYVGTSLSDMTEATGLTKGSIYGNFSCKEEVALAAFDRNWNMVVDLIATEMSKHKSSKEKLMVYTKLYRQFPDAPFPEGGCPLLNTAVDSDDTNIWMRRRATGAFFHWRMNLEKLIQRGIDFGEFRPDVDVDRTALSIIALIEGAVMVAKLTNSKTDPGHIMTTLENLINELA